MTTIILKNHTRTTDKRLDRIEHFDERSRDYPAIALLSEEERETSEPKTHFWTFFGCLVQALDQGPDGACVGFAFTHDLMKGPLTPNFVRSWIQGPEGDGYQFAKQKVYWEAQKIDGYSGGSYPGAEPQYDGTTVLAGAKVMTGLGFYSEYRWAFGADDLARSMALGPFVIGVNWYERMFDTNTRGLIRPSGKVRGKHAVAVYGFDSDRFYIRNSWGPEWGRNGSAFLRYEDMDRLLQENGEACIPLTRATGPSDELTESS